MSDKVELKEKLQAVDQNIRELWDAMDATNQKALKNEFFILNRYVSNVQSNNTELQKHFVTTVNTYFNKHWNLLQKHPKLMWLLLCMCSANDGKTYFHQWIGFKKKEGSDNKRVRFLAELYPNKKMEEVEMLSKLMTDKDIKDLARRYGFDEPTIAKKLK